MRGAGGLTAPRAAAAAPPLRRAFDGADVFVAVLDRALRRAGMPGFHSMVVLDLASPPDVDRLRAAVAADAPLARWLRAPVRRTLAARRFVRDAAAPGAPPRVDVLPAPPPGEDAPWTSLLSAPLRVEEGENARFTVFPVPRDDGAPPSWRVAFVFSHLLLDAKAAERLLAALSGGDAAADWPDGRSLLGGEGIGGLLTATRAHAAGIAPTDGAPLRVVADGAPLAAPDAAPGCGAATLALDEAQTRAAVAAGRRAAGYAMEGLWYLACALAADRDLHVVPGTTREPRRAEPRRGPAPRYAVPLPTSLDRKGAARAFGNHLVFLFLDAPVADAADPAALARRFRARMLDHLARRADRASQAQMEVFRALPLALHDRLVRRTVGGAFGSLLFTNPGDVPRRLERFLGADVRDVVHVPVPAPDPGVCAATWTFRGRLRLGLSWLRPRCSDDRARALLRRWGERVVEVPA